MNRRTLFLAVLMLPMLAGCAGPVDSYTPTASPTWSDAARCERNGAVWHENLGICEVMHQ